MTYAIDFDGILYKDNEINLDACKRINELRTGGDKVVLHTSRQGEALKKALELIGDECDFDEVVSGKYYADKYIDDRNMSLDEFLSCGNGEKRMAIKSDREYRSFQLMETRASEGEEKSYKVRGYASTFEPYELWNDGEYKYMEQMDRKAFDEADMSDVIFLYNHEGMVFARIKNGTLECSIDDHGLLTEADLLSTTQSRELFESIQSGLIDQMSFAFTVEEDDIEVDRKAKVCTRTIKKIRKIYDVSAVSIPANPGTDISAKSARSAFDGVIEELEAERLQRQKELAEAKAKYFEGGLEK